MRAAEFSLTALYEALDAQRRARSLTWAEAVRQINSPFDRLPSRPIAVSTVTSTRTKPVAEGDGVLQMLRWLNRTPESFVPSRVGDAADECLPAAGPNQIIRFDARKLHAALNAQRIDRQMTWAQVSIEIGRITAVSLMHLSKGGRTGFPHVMRITRWLDRPLALFTRVCSR